jgi:hypothetical protein
MDSHNWIEFYCISIIDYNNECAEIIFKYMRKFKPKSINFNDPLLKCRDNEYWLFTDYYEYIVSQSV